MNFLKMFFLKDEKNVILKIFSLFKPYKKRIFIIILCILASAGISMVLPVISKNMMDEGLIVNNIKVVIELSALTLFLVLLDQGIGMIETLNQAYLNSIINYDLSRKAFKHTMKLKMQYFSDVGIVELMNNINMDVGNVARVTDRATFYIVTSIFKILGGLIGLLLIDLKLTLLVVFMLPLRYFIVKYLARIRREGFENLMKASSDYSAWYGDTLGGVKEIKLWGLEKIKFGQFVKKQRSIMKTNIKLNITDKVNELSETLMFQLIISILYVAGAFMVAGKSFTIGGMFAFVTYSTYVMAPISAILNIGYNFSGIIPSAKRFFNFLDMECEVDKNDRNLARISNRIIRGNIIFENVSFSYKEDEEILNKTNFEINPGEKVAIIGANGSGKSTLINLLMRFYKPKSGKILMDGIDINYIKLSDYRSTISVVSQDLYLFNTTIEENICVGSKVNESKVRKAAKESSADEFIQEMPMKYKTNVGKNGAKLSGGQKQKIVMARAFERNTKILVLDEATSSFDMESEAYVNELLNMNFKDKTVIIISHKPDILKKVDKILLLKCGKVIQYNGYYELMNSDMKYGEIFVEEKSAV